MQFRVLGYGPWAKIILNNIKYDGVVDTIITRSDKKTAQWNHTTSKNSFFDQSNNYYYFLCADQQTNKEYLKQLVVLGAKAIWVEKPFNNDPNLFDILTSSANGIPVFFNYTHYFSSAVEQIIWRDVNSVEFNWTKRFNHRDALENLACHDLAIIIKKLNLSDQNVNLSLVAQQDNELNVNMELDGIKISLNYLNSDTEKKKVIRVNGDNTYDLYNNLPSKMPLRAALNVFYSRSNYPFTLREQAVLSELYYKMSNFGVTNYF